VLEILKQTWTRIQEAKAQRAAVNQFVITVCGQKWLGPAETLRIVEVELEGSRHRLALWNTKSATQMIELRADEEKIREATC
jgi:hypothetical protein